MNIIYNDIPPVLRNKSEESEDFQCEEGTCEHKVRIAHASLSITDNVAVAC